MIYTYTPHGVCSKKITIELKDGIIKSCQFEGGCNGNLQAVSILADGMTVDEIKEKLLGIRCGFKDTSCSDQLARAIIKASEKEASEKSGEPASADS